MGVSATGNDLIEIIMTYMGVRGPSGQFGVSMYATNIE